MVWAHPRLRFMSFLFRVGFYVRLVSLRVNVLVFNSCFVVWRVELMWRRKELLWVNFRIKGVGINLV